MKIVTGSIAVSMSALVAALLIGAAGAADAQQSRQRRRRPQRRAVGRLRHAGRRGGNECGNRGRRQSNARAVGLSTGATGSIGSGPTLNNMRANGTAWI